MHSDVFSVIADPTRRRIVRILAEQTHTVGAVVEKLSMSQPTISKHLKVLRDADVVSVTVEGQRRLYSLNPEVFATVTDWINETVQIARRASEAPVALPGSATLSSEHAPTEKAEAVATEPAVEKVTEPKTAEAPEVKPVAQSAEQPAAEAQPTAEELEQERIRRARAQYITPNTRIIARPAHPAPAEASPVAASETTRDSESQAIPEHEPQNPSRNPQRAKSPSRRRRALRFPCPPVTASTRPLPTALIPLPWWADRFSPSSRKAQLRKAPLRQAPPWKTPPSAPKKLP